MSGGSSRGMARDIKSQQRLETRYVFSCDESGPTLLTNAGHATFVKNGAGDYTITLGIAALRDLNALVTPYTAQRFAAIGTRSTSAIQILLYDELGAAADGDFCCEIIAFDSSDDT